MTKLELLGTMAKRGACREATVYVRSHACDDAATIIENCTRVDWLIWLLGRELRLSRFVRVCANRASKRSSVYAVETREAAEHYGAYAAEGICGAAAVWADYASQDARAAASDTRAERAAQLKGLQRIGRDWANGLPAEV